MSSPSVPKFLFLALLGSCLIACGQSQPADDAPAAEKASPRHFIGKPRAPVDARLLAGLDLHAGVPATVMLEIRPAIAVDGIEVLLEGDEGLSIVSPASIRLPATAAGEARSVEIELTPVSGGTRRLGAVLTLLMHGGKQVRPVSLDLQAGGPVTIPARSGKPEREPVRDASGELVYSMEAETTTR